MNDAYDQVYRDFDSPLMRQIRAEAYGEDIGQHSWVTADELRADFARLDLNSSTRLLDLGCGPGGPLTFLAERARCSATGLEFSDGALQVARQRAQALGLERLVEFQRADLNRPIALATARFQVAISYDVVLHLDDRAAFFAEVARVLSPGAKFLLTDAGVINGSVSKEQLARRSHHGSTQFVAPGFNERCLLEAGFSILDTEDRTHNVIANARGRLNARGTHRAELEPIEGAEVFDGLQAYLQAVIELSDARTIRRVMYCAQRR